MDSWVTQTPCSRFLKCPHMACARPSFNVWTMMGRVER